MKKLALEVDERELRTIQAALLLLQEQIDALPEDLAEMMTEHGPPLTEIEVGELAQRIGTHEGHLEADLPRAENGSRSSGDHPYSSGHKRKRLLVRRFCFLA